MAHWYNRLIAAPPAVRDWLTDRRSLTRRLRTGCAGFCVRGLQLRRATVQSDERRPVGLSARRRALIRNVWLCCGEQPLVYAHSVLPQDSLSGSWRRLAHLGNRPLGEALFADARIRRGMLQYCLLPRTHPLWRQAAAGTAVTGRLWARRSLFGSGRQRILVTEVFMPDVFA
ncbi:MAG: chorismate lyase [Betaproteobacteria bacterium]|nr:chorismate lyase [Betaproteobacteria bacterium]